MVLKPPICRILALFWLFNGSQFAGILRLSSRLKHISLQLSATSLVRENFFSIFWTFPKLFFNENQSHFSRKSYFLSIKFDSVLFFFLLNQNCFRKVIYRRFLGKSQEFWKRAKITKAKIISVLEIANFFRKVFPSKQTFKMETNLATPKKIPEEKFQNS